MWLWKQAKLRPIGNSLWFPVCVHFVTKVKKRNRKKSGGKQNGFPDERRRKGLSQKKQKNKTFETSALNCFTLPKTRTKEHHVQAIKENFCFYVCVQILLFLKRRPNLDNSNFRRQANWHQKSKNFKNVLTIVSQNWTWKENAFFEIKDILFDMTAKCRKPSFWILLLFSKFL